MHSKKEAYKILGDAVKAYTEHDGIKLIRYLRTEMDCDVRTAKDYYDDWKKERGNNGNKGRATASN